MRAVLHAALLIVALPAAAGFAAQVAAPGGGVNPPPAGATAHLADAQGAPHGTVTVTQTAKGLRLVIEATGLPAGEHGFHVHTVGRCDAPDFATAGAHWNPTGKKHGHDAPGGQHMGDLPNLVIGADGTGRLETLILGGAVASGETPLLDTDGAAIVIHAAADDYRTDPSGNSGARIACGVFAAG